MKKLPNIYIETPRVRAQPAGSVMGGVRADLIYFITMCLRRVLSARRSINRGKSHNLEDPVVQNLTVAYALLTRARRHLAGRELRAPPVEQQFF